MIETKLSPIERWQADFEQQPFDALHRLLIGRAYMGRLNRNDTDEILFRLFHIATRDCQTALDEAMRRWFEAYSGIAPPSISAARWSDILQNAFSTVIRLNLRETQSWLLDNHVHARERMRSLYLAPSRAPETYLLRTLALCQRDQALLPLWMRVCRLEEDIPLHFASLGLLGLRKLPDENGEPPGDLPKAVFRGIVDLANAIDERVRPKKEGEAFWSLEVRALMARYPRSPQYWADNFLSPVSSEPDSAAAKWLGKLIPRLRKTLDGTVTNTKRILCPPPRREREAILELLKKRPLHELKPDIIALLKKYRNYALQTGDAELLVKMLSNVGNSIFKQEPNWALSMVKEAFNWEPYNPYLWTARAKIESYLSRGVRAVGLLWEAKRRFSENPRIRTDLAKLLRKQGKNELAEIVYCQAVEDFPENAYFRSGLAEVLREQRKPDYAEEVYRQAIEDFPTNPVYLVGLAVVLLIQGKREDGIRLLEETVEKFPDNLIAKGFWQRITGGQEALDDVVADYEDFSATMADAEKPVLADEPFIETEDESVMPTSPVGKEYTSQESQPPSDAVAAHDKELSAAMAEAEKPDLADETFIEAENEIATPILPVSEEDTSEVQIGLANLYRLAARRAEGEEKERYQQEFVTACESALADSPNNTFALLEQGFGMLDQQPANAEAFFAERTSKQSHFLGFRMGCLQAKIWQGETVSDEQWDELIDEFPGRKTLINLENARQELRHANGTTLSALETLRRQIIRADMEMLPSSLRENEKWVRASVERRLFAEIDLEHPLTEDVLPLLLENHAQSELILRGVVEQSLAKI